MACEAEATAWAAAVTVETAAAYDLLAKTSALASATAAQQAALSAQQTSLGYYNAAVADTAAKLAALNACLGS